MAGDAWRDFIQKVEVSGPSPAVIDATVEFFTKTLGIDKPLLAEGYSEDMFADKLPKEPAVTACIRRVLKTIQAIGEAKRLQTTGAAASSGDVAATASAATLAQLINPTKQADVAGLLSKSGISGIPYTLQAEPALWNQMHAHSEEARAAKRTPFLFVDLTAKESLPMWLTPDMIGGKFQLHEDDWPLRGQAPISSLQDFGKALKSATSSPRFFRTVQQWTGAFLRYAVVAVATDQLTSSTVLSHMDVVMQLAEQERQKGNRPYLAFLYDELLRKNWSRRAEKRDPELKIADEAQRIDRDIVDVARHRLSEVLRETGLQQQEKPVPGLQPQPPVLTQGADEMLSRQLAAAEATQKQTARAQQQLAETQRQILAKADAMQNVPDPTKSQPSKRALKTQLWLQKGRQRKQEQQEQKRWKQQQGY